MANLTEKLDKAIANKVSVSRKATRTAQLMEKLKAKENGSVKGKTDLAEKSVDNSELSDPDLRIFLDNVDGAYFNLTELALEMSNAYGRVHRILEDAGQPGIVSWLKGEEKVLKFRLTFDGTPLGKAKASKFNYRSFPNKRPPPE